MRARKTKAEPLTLDSLLKLRSQIEKQLTAMRADGVKQTGPLQDLHSRCKEAIHLAQAEKRIAAARFDAN